MLLLLLLSLIKAHAFPEMVRHHYVNCNACHVSPAGGGALTPYGRMTASELLSTWGSEREAMFLHGLPNPDKWPEAVKMGGDFRAIQVHRENRSLREGRFVVMQTSLEGGVELGPFTAMASFGRPGRDRRIHPDFTRFYLLANATDQLQLRAGRFVPAYGLNVPHHTLPTRMALGFGYESERDTLEAHWSGEQWHGAASVSRSLPKSAVQEKEIASSLQLETFLLDSYRLGISGWAGESEKQKRVLASVHGILGFTPHFYALAELALQNKRSKLAPSGRSTGVFQFARLGYEVTKGLHLLALEEFTKTNSLVPSSQSHSFGVGTLWYPRPHLEFELTFSQRRNFQVSREWEDYAYLLLHYYL